jgi:cytoskeletal protein RodZ
MQTVGTYLKKEREAKNISLGEVSQLTKISKFYLDFLEKDDYEKLPQGPYIKGYISSYARLIGSNADEAIKLYNSLQEQTNQPAADPTERVETAAMPVSVASLGEKIGSSFTNLTASLKTKTAALKADASALETLAVSFKKISTSIIAAGSSLKAAIPSSAKVVSTFKAAGASINAIGPSISTVGSTLKKIGPFLRRAGATLDMNRHLCNRRIWLHAGFGLVSSGILVLAGFGFYHLFIYDNHPAPVAKMETLADAKVNATHAAPAGENVEPGPSQNLAKASVKPVEAQNNQTSAPLVTATAVRKNPPPASTPAAGATREPTIADNFGTPPQSVTSKSVQAAKKEPPSGNTPSMAIAAGKESAPGVPQRPVPTPSPKSPSSSTNLSVTEASISENIKNRMPAGVGTSFSWSIPRVYVWSLVKAKQFPSKIRHIYYFGSQKISDVELNVRSSSWRTWSYQTISDKRHKGMWRVDIATADGQVLRSLHFEVN